MPNFDWLFDWFVKFWCTEHGVVKNGVINNGVVKNGVVKNGVVKNGVVKNGVVKNGVVRNGVVKNVDTKKVYNESFKKTKRKYSSPDVQNIQSSRENRSVDLCGGKTSDKTKRTEINALRLDILLVSAISLHFPLLFFGYFFLS